MCLSLLRSYYIGITENPHRRFREHSRSYDGMVVLYQARSSRESGALERRLIAEFAGMGERQEGLAGLVAPQSGLGNLRCRNYGRGGEHASIGSPHYTYVVWRSDGLLRF